VTDRNEADRPEILSGVFENKTLGTPIAMFVRNEDARSGDYAEMTKQARPGHADDVWKNKFQHNDPRGGGRTSGRETLARVMGGAVAQMFLAHECPALRVLGFARAIGPFQLSEEEVATFTSKTEPHAADLFAARFPSVARSAEIEDLLVQAKSQGRSYGGVVEVRVAGCAPGWGQPVFHKLKADLAAAVMSVGATVSFEIGAGFAATQAEGSEFHRSGDAQIYGGIRGGIATGEPLILRVGFKPTATVLHAATKGRHDPCIVPRAIPVLEAMIYLVLADHCLQVRGDKLTSAVSKREQI
jgi:chorismate synthase